MKKLLLGTGAVALLSIAGYVVAQTSQNQSSTATTTTTTTATSTATATPTSKGSHLAAADTSMDAFRKLDTDNDGRISALEANANPKVAAAFVMADKDKDGYLSREEFEAMSSTQMHADVDASSPSGDRASDPSGDQPATDPNDVSPSDSPSPRVVARPHH
jgi:hypothetical protein